ncbi:MULTISPECIES: YgjV family protein [unclassified Butyrivibrio]|uniref:YgjV family protein n=1 Tax=unclassified Butyrivibrio TaxID=2639466 RepID=UPI0008E48046|nr:MULTISPECIES: YgjV family protein [unclassified Butyrivibrio]RKM56092.1 hypothetical protein D6856_14935 [Butyrivibrio sp. XB500-5]SFU94843.1 inner membrane protein [Butyrivibrio sp. INlla21]
MNTNMIIEAIGYLGSALVLVSFLMASVVKLRIINSIGSIIFTIYAFIIHSYPTALMNLCLVLINIYYLVKMSNTSVEYDFIKLNKGDSVISYFIDCYKDDIQKCFPGNPLDFSTADTGYAVCHKGNPAGVLLGRLEDNNLDIMLDYSTPEYRDFSIGKFLISKLPDEGIKSMTYRGNDVNHKAYLSKVGFKQKDGYYEKLF